MHGVVEERTGTSANERERTRTNANMRAPAAQRLEGSRFVSRQLCSLVAGGSRERLGVLQFYGWQENRSQAERSRWLKILRWVIPGSRLLPTYR
ncbi:MAG: hypothetical protein WAM44_20040, partial [Chthoniobacterales bacterium]